MLEAQAMTAAQAGLDVKRQIQIALETIVARGGEATSDQIYEAVERYMPDGTALSQQGRDTLLRLWPGRSETGCPRL